MIINCRITPILGKLMNIGNLTQTVKWLADTCRFAAHVRQLFACLSQIPDIHQFLPNIVYIYIYIFILFINVKYRNRIVSYNYIRMIYKEILYLKFLTNHLIIYAIGQAYHLQSGLTIKLLQKEDVTFHLILFYFKLKG